MIDAISERLQRKLTATADLEDVRHVRSFRAARTRPDWSSAELLIELLDRGPASDLGRYTVVATDVETKRSATGNSSDDLDLALGLVHWESLDR